MISKDRKRNIGNRESKRVILIAYEGKNKTEKNYFNGFKGIDKDYVIKVVPGNETDPVNLVKQTIQNIKDLGLILENDDRAFCVFDTDTNSQKNSQIIEAITIANNKNIKVITSSPCFETWFLLHFEFTTASMTNNNVISRLQGHYSKYTKNCSMYPVIVDKTSNAYTNAIKLEKYQKDNNKNVKLVEANPHTDVYKIIDELIKSKM